MIECPTVRSGLVFNLVYDVVDCPDTKIDKNKRNFMCFLCVINPILEENGMEMLI